MGHLAWMRTHELSLRGPSEAVGEFGSAQLRRIRFSEHNPFWVVGATPDVINGHNGIWQQPFIDLTGASAAPTNDPPTPEFRFAP
jgi:hypothetical protein